MLIEVYDDAPMFGHHLVGRWTVEGENLSLILVQLGLNGKAQNPAAKAIHKKAQPLKLVPPAVEYPGDVEPPGDLEEVPKMEP